MRNDVLISVVGCVGIVDIICNFEKINTLLIANILLTKYFRIIIFHEPIRNASEFFKYMQSLLNKKEF